MSSDQPPAAAVPTSGTSSTWAAGRRRPERAVWLASSQCPRTWRPGIPVVATSWLPAQRASVAAIRSLSRSSAEAAPSHSGSTSAHTRRSASA